MAKRAAIGVLLPDANHLLAALPAGDLARLRGVLDLVPLNLGRALYEAGSQLGHMDFPVSGVVSLLYTLADGGTAELAVVGRDGCVGIPVLLGGGATPSRAVVQIAGHAYRAPAEAVREAFGRGGPIQLVFLRYIQALMTQMAQTAVCNRHHTVEQQLCRWLLLSLDRIYSDEIDMTQELISSMLGVRRTGITQAAKTLQRAGLIEYRRGHIRIPDRAKLEARVCECYSVVKKETDRLLRDAPRYAAAAH